jgi:hypothetical protein
MAKLSFNKSKAKKANSTYGAIPRGFYMITAEKATIKESPDKEILTLQCSITEGPFKNRKIFPRFNIKNPSERAEAISHMLLSQLSEAVGITELEDTDQLLNSVFCAEVVVTEARNGYPETNDIVRYFDFIAKTESENKAIDEYVEKAKTAGEDDFAKFDFEDKDKKKDEVKAPEDKPDAKSMLDELDEFDFTDNDVPF